MQIPEAPETLYQDFDVQVSPAWLQVGENKEFVEGLAEVKDLIIKRLYDVVLARYPSQAPDSALGVIGRDRKLTSFDGESLDAFRARLSAAFEWWSRSGTPNGLIRALELAGYTATIGEHHTDITIPDGFFTINITPIPPFVPDFTPPIWGNPPVLPWGTPPVRPWGYQAEVFRLLGIVNILKPAHMRLARITLIDGGPPEIVYDIGVI